MHVALRLIIDAGRGAVHCRANYKPRPSARAATYSIKSAKVVITSCTIGHVYLCRIINRWIVRRLHTNALECEQHTHARLLAFVRRFRSRPAFEIAHPSKPLRMQRSTAHAFDRSLIRLNISIFILVFSNLHIVGYFSDIFRSRGYKNNKFYRRVGYLICGL
jgi:hypothetical protein